MRLNLKEIIDELDNLGAFLQRTTLDTNRKVMYINWAQEALQELIDSEVPDGAKLFTGRQTITLDGSGDGAGGYSLAPNCKNILYVEHSADQTAWARIAPMDVRDKQLQAYATESDLWPLDAYAKIHYTRRLSPLFYGDLANESASMTSAVLPSVPLYSATGGVETEDDAYNGATLVDLDNKQESEITDYDGSTRTATVSFSTNVESGTTVALRCDLLPEHHRVLVLNALDWIAPENRWVERHLAQQSDQMLSALHGRVKQELGYRRGDDERVEYSSHIAWYLWGGKIHFLKV